LDKKADYKYKKANSASIFCTVQNRPPVNSKKIDHWSSSSFWWQTDSGSCN